MNQTTAPTAAELWRSSLILAVTTAVAAGVLALGHMNIPGLSLWQDLQLLLVSTSLAGLLVFWCRRPNAVLCRIAFLAVVASAIVAMTVNQHLLAESRRLFPFMGHKAMLVAIALIARSRSLGLIAIGAVTLAGTLQALASGGTTAAVGSEPLLTCLFAVIAVVMLLLRSRGHSAERALVLARADTTAAQHLASTFLAIRDLANTPLQTLVLAIGVLERRHGTESELVGGMKRALEQLQRLNEVLVTAELDLRADSPHLDAFDPWQELDKRLAPQNRPRK